MLDVHPVISECDKSDEPEIVTANVDDPPFIVRGSRPAFQPDDESCSR